MGFLIKCIISIEYIIMCVLDMFILTLLFFSAIVPVFAETGDAAEVNGDMTLAEGALPIT